MLHPAKLTPASGCRCAGRQWPPASTRRGSQSPSSATAGLGPLWVGHHTGRYKSSDGMSFIFKTKSYLAAEHASSGAERRCWDGSC